jgi:uncharacterized protein YndB with AHSA1/START domain
MSSDCIEKTILLRAPRERVWRALSDSQQFGAWFGVKLDGPFSPGALVRGTIVGTVADPGIAAAQKQFEGVPFEITVDRIEPQTLISFRWHPNAVDPNVDYSHEPTTLIEFTLKDAPNGTILAVTESGFDRIPLARRAKAFTASEQGWGFVLQLVEKYLAQTA